MPRKIEAIYPTSPVQKALLLSSQRSGLGASGIELIVVKLAGACDLSAFSKACRHLVEQHAVFRTAFVWTDSGESYQVISREVPVAVYEEDWTSVLEPQIPERLRNLATVDRTTTFDLAKAPLLRIKLLRLDGSRSILLWTHHHALLDGWCIPMLFRELLTAYAAFLNGTTPERQPRRPYQDYIQWLTQQDGKKAELFWRNVLAGFETFTTIRGYERLIPSGESGPGAHADESLRFSPETAARLQASCQGMKITLNTLFQAAWALVLSLYSGEKDVLFGATVSGRPPSLTGVERMIGPFFNTIPVRVRVNPDMEMQPWLAEIQERQVQARQYEYVSTPQLCEWSGWPVGASLFETLLVFQNYPSDPFDVSDLIGTLRVNEVVSPVRSSYPLTLSVNASLPMELVLAYAISRFRRTDIVRMLRLMESCLVTIAGSGPDQRLGDLSYVERACQSPPLTEVNGFAAEAPDTFACKAEPVVQDGSSDTVILNQDKQVVPAGVVGELYTTPEKLRIVCANGTDESKDLLQSAPLGLNTRSSLHRTGLLAKCNAAEEVEVVGRLDRLARHGRRWLSLDQIENTLLEHPDVAEASVVESQDILVCHCAARDPGMQLDAKGLRAFLRLHLPEYMVPGTYVQVGALPKDAKGAVDEAALVDMPTQFGQAETATEEIIGSIWAQLTGARVPSVNHDLLLLCGNSLVAAQMTARISAIFGILLSISVFFEQPTIAALAEKVDLRRRQSNQPALPIAASDKSPQDMYPVSFAQERLWFLDQLSPGNSSYNVALAFRISGVLDCAAMQHAVSALVARHESLRTTFVDVRGVPWQLVGRSPEVYLVRVDLTCVAKAEREEHARRVLRLLAMESLNLKSGPLFRAVLVDSSADEHYLLFNIHHIAFDGWSSGILMRELVELYQASVLGRPPALPPLRIQYKDFALWQRKMFGASAYQPEIVYWRRQLSPEPSFALPTDYPRPQVRTYSGASVRFECGAEVSMAVEVLRRSEGATTFIILLSAFQALLRAYTAAQEVVVATDVANREEPELEHVIGFFVNQIVLRSDLSGNPTFRELIARNRKTVLAAYDNQRLPFNKLVEQIRPRRTGAQQPLFQVLFVMQNTPLKTPVPGCDLTIETLPLDLPFSNFDLALFVNDSAEQLNGLWMFNTSLFAATTIHRMSLGFVTLLEHAVQNPDMQLQSLIALVSEQHAGAQGVLAQPEQACNSSALRVPH